MILIELEKLIEQSHFITGQGIFSSEVFASEVVGSIPVLICIVPSHFIFLQFFSMKMRFTPYGVKIKNDQWTQFYMIGLKILKK